MTQRPTRSPKSSRIVRENVENSNDYDLLDNLNFSEIIIQSSLSSSISSDNTLASQSS